MALADKAIDAKQLRIIKVLDGFIVAPRLMVNWYGTGSGSDRAPSKAPSPPAPGRYRSRRRTGGHAAFPSAQPTWG